MTKLSIIIPAWNEEKRIGRTLIQYIKYFSKKYDFEILVITDGCKDKTEEIISNLCLDTSSLRHLSFPEKLGKGGAIIEGIKEARGTYIAFTDADGSTPPEELEKLIAHSDGWDSVIGSRWLDKSLVLKRQPLTRCLASRAFNILVRLFFGLHFDDTQCGAKIFRNFAILDVVDELGLTNFAFDVDLLFHLNKKGYTIKEVPVCWIDHEDSCLDLKKVVPTMFLSLLGLRLSVSRVWRFIPRSFTQRVYQDIMKI